MIDFLYVISFSCLFIYLFIHLFVYSFICLFIHLVITLDDMLVSKFAKEFDCLFVKVLVSLFFHLFIYVLFFQGLICLLFLLFRQLAFFFRFYFFSSLSNFFRLSFQYFSPPTLPLFFFPFFLYCAYKLAPPIMMAFSLTFPSYISLVLLLWSMAAIIFPTSRFFLEKFNKPLLFIALGLYLVSTIANLSGFEINVSTLFGSSFFLQKNKTNT